MSSSSRQDSFDGAMTRSAVVLDPGLLPPEIAITEEGDQDYDWHEHEAEDEHENNRNKLGAALRRVPSAVSIESKNVSDSNQSSITIRISVQSLDVAIFVENGLQRQFRHQ